MPTSRNRFFQVSRRLARRLGGSSFHSDANLRLDCPILDASLLINFAVLPFMFSSVRVVVEIEIRGQMGLVSARELDVRGNVAVRTGEPSHQSGLSRDLRAAWTMEPTSSMSLSWPNAITGDFPAG